MGDQAAFEVEQVGSDEMGVRLVDAGFESIRPGFSQLRTYRGGAGAVGNCGDDLEGRPEARVSGQVRGVEAEVQDVLGVCRVEGRDEQVCQGDLGRAGERRRLATGIVSDEGDDAASRIGPHEVGVANRV